MRISPHPMWHRILLDSDFNTIPPPVTTVTGWGLHHVTPPDVRFPKIKGSAHLHNIHGTCGQPYLYLRMRKTKPGKVNPFAQGHASVSSRGLNLNLVSIQQPFHYSGQDSTWVTPCISPWTDWQRQPGTLCCDGIMASSRLS